MSSTERAELTGYLRIYASEMEKEYGPAVAQELVKGMLSGQDYTKRNPDSEVMRKAQSIMNTWATINPMRVLVMLHCYLAAVYWVIRLKKVWLLTRQ